MATPKGPTTASTPKNVQISTPNRPIASPRHNAGNFASKSLPNKSPAAKTPTSHPGHSHRMSMSSHNVSTPLNVPTIHDELLNLNSPATALIASLGQTGLTPMTSGQDGLGITSAVVPHIARDNLQALKSPEAEKLARLQQVASLLRRKIAGRGITRDGIERVAKIQGFTILWDEDNLTIAGTNVDLEIVFDQRDKDVIREVMFRLNTSEAEEPVLQNEASKILMKHLTPIPESWSKTSAYPGLERFCEDLEYLSQLDHLDTSINSFELVAEFYETLHNIWDAESQRLQGRSEADHICISSVGKPQINSYDHLGVTVQYWPNARVLSTPRTTSSDSQSESAPSWLARFSIQKGSPGISSYRKWLKQDTLQNTATTKDVFEDAQIDKPNWSEPGSLKGITQAQKDADTMLLDVVPSEPSDSLDLVFVCKFKSAIVLPLIVATGLSTVHAMLSIDQAHTLPYQQAVFKASKFHADTEWSLGMRWRKSTPYTDEKGKSSIKQYSYTFFANGIPWSYPVDQITFAHPKDFVEVLPIFRQYTVIWTLLCSLLTNADALGARDSLKTPDRLRMVNQMTVKRRNNKGAVNDQYVDLLMHEAIEDTIGRVDVSLDVVTDAFKPTIDIIIPLMKRTTHAAGSHFIRVRIEVRANGIIDVPLIRGISPSGATKMKNKAIKILTLTEDLSILVAWLSGEVETI